MKLRVTKKFLLSLKDSKNRCICSFRANKDLYDFAKADAEAEGMSLVDYMNNLMLAKHLNAKEGFDTFKCLAK